MRTLREADAIYFLSVEVAEEGVKGCGRQMAGEKVAGQEKVGFSGGVQRRKSG